jgi:hypothetical protein
MERPALGRRNARILRLLAAVLRTPSTAAVSSFVNISNWRGASTSRSSGSMALRASCTRICNSARTAAWVGEVNRPSSWFASDTDDAWGSAPRYSDTLCPASRMWVPRWWRCKSSNRWPVRKRSHR